MHRLLAQLPGREISAVEPYTEWMSELCGAPGSAEDPRPGLVRVSLGALLSAVGPAVLTGLASPRGLGAPIGQPVITDGQLDGRVTGSTLLLVGWVGAAEIERAARAGAVAIAARIAPGSASGLGLTAERAGVALLSVSDQVSWGELYSMIRTLFTVYEPTNTVSVDLFELANRVARAAGGAVAIEDMSMRVVAYSSVDGQDIDDLRLAGILGRRVPEEAVQAEEYLQVLHADDAIWCLEPPENAPRLAIGVRSQGQAYGTIWVVQGVGSSLVSNAPQILAEAAEQAAPQLARMQLSSDVVRRQRDDRLRRLITGIGSPEALATELELQGTGPFTVVFFGPQAGSDDELDATVVADSVRGALDSYRITAAVGVADDVAAAVIEGDPDRALFERVLLEALERVRQRYGPSWRAAVGRNIKQIDRLTESTMQAGTLLAAMPQTQPGSPPTVVYHERMAPTLLLHALAESPSMTPLLAGEPISTIRAHDAEHGTEYLRTLRAWAETHYDVPLAAEALFLHPNTMRHRLGRIRGIIDLNDPDVRLALTLQLRLAEISLA